MTTLQLKGGHLITPLDERFTNLWIAGGRIAALSDSYGQADANIESLDCTGCFVTPGLFDLQVNGGPAASLWGDPTDPEIRLLRESLASQGTTSFLPTLITDEVEHLKKNIALLTSHGAGNVDAPEGPLARMPGIHLEGPCLSPARPGVHPARWLRKPDLELIRSIAVPGVRLVTLAPELDPSGTAIEWLKEKGIRVSLGHSDATEKEAQKAFQQGVRLITHTFNALSPLHHRAPGAVGAALVDPEVTCCIICDGLHIDPLIARLVIFQKGVGRVILVTDAAQVGTTQGGLVGSSILLSDAVRNVVSWGIVPFTEAVRMATWNPAAALGLEGEIGHLAPGKAGDAVVWDRSTLAIKHVVLGGKVIV